MYIRPATLADLDPLVDLGRRTFFDAFVDNHAPADMAQYLTEAFSPQRMQAELLASGSVFLMGFEDATPDAVPMGYARLLENSAEPCVTGAKPIELVRLYVEKALKGQGCGSMLMQACLDYAASQGFETIWLGVWEKNYAAQGFYAHWGFQQVGAHGFQVGQDLQTDWILARPVAAPAGAPTRA